MGKAAALAVGLGGSEAPPRVGSPGDHGPEMHLLLSLWRAKLKWAAGGGAGGGGRAPWYRVEFQGELPWAVLSAGTVSRRILQ